MNAVTDKFNPRLLRTAHLLEKLEAHVHAGNLTAAMDTYDLIDPTDRVNMHTMMAAFELHVICLERGNPNAEVRKTILGTMQKLVDAMMVLGPTEGFVWYCKLRLKRHLEGAESCLGFICAFDQSLPECPQISFLAALCAGELGQVAEARIWHVRATVEAGKFKQGNELLASNDEVFSAGLLHRELEPLWPEFRTGLEVNQAIRRSAATT